MDDEKDVGFKVSDRRMFHSDGTPREDQSESTFHQTTAKQPLTAEPEQPEAEEPGPVPARVLEFPGESARKKEEAKADEGKAGAHSAVVEFRSAAAKLVAEEMPEATFEGLVNMLAVEAVMHLGLIENPMNGGRSVDIGSAAQVIDLLGVLDEKTGGNLDPEEATMMKDVLSDLRTQFFVVADRK